MSITYLVIEKTWSRFANIGERMPLNNGLVDQGERFFRELADNAPVMIWRSGPDKLCDWFNKSWLDSSGGKWNKSSGTAGRRGYNPEDFDRCLKTYFGAFDRRQSFFDDVSAASS
jgi:two-component system, sensor histidine kinase PdtaS